mgnify:CR=1 FL=1
MLLNTVEGNEVEVNMGEILRGDKPLCASGKHDWEKHNWGKPIFPKNGDGVVKCSSCGAQCSCARVESTQNALT